MIDTESAPDRRLVPVFASRAELVAAYPDTVAWNKCPPLALVIDDPSSHKPVLLEPDKTEGWVLHSAS